MNLSLISALFLALFCWLELNQPHPLIDIRLLRDRNFAFGNIFSMAFGFVVSYSPILVQYLSQIQGYNPEQISAVLIWAALANPLTGKLLEHFDARLMMGIGTGIFIISCFMNSTLDYYVAHDQLIWSQVVKATGLPLLGAGISFVATENIKKEQYNNASAIYNLLRATASTVAGAALGALLTKREQYHSNIITDDVSIYNQPTQARLQQLIEFFTGGRPSCRSISGCAIYLRDCAPAGFYYGIQRLFLYDWHRNDPGCYFLHTLFNKD